MAIIAFDRIPRIPPALDQWLREHAPLLGVWLQDLVVFLYEWRRQYEADIANVGAAGELTVKDEGVTVGTAGGITSIDFVGAGVVATASGVNATVTISGAAGSGAFDWGKYIAGLQRFPHQ